MKEIRVVIFDDNTQLRETMFNVVDSSEGFTCSGGFANCNDVLTKLEATKCPSKTKLTR